MLSFKNRISCASTEEADENSSCPYNCNVLILKTQERPRDNPENCYWEKTSQNETIGCPGKQFIFSSKWYSTSNPLSSQLSTIASQSTLGVELDLHQPIPRGANFGWNNRCFQGSRRCEFPHFTLDAIKVFFSKLLILFNFSSFIWLLIMPDTSWGNTYARAGV